MFVVAEIGFCGGSIDLKFGLMKSSRIMDVIRVRTHSTGRHITFIIVEGHDQIAISLKPVWTRKIAT